MIDNKAFHHFSSGLYLLSTAVDGKNSGCIINTALQVTSKPFQISVTVNKENYTEQLMEKSGVFSVSALNEDADMDLIGVFGFKSSKDIDKFAGFNVKNDINGVPYVDEKSAARFSCKIIKSLDVGTHMIFVGEVVEAEVMSGNAMTYSYYRQVVKGGTPAKASSYIPIVEEDKKSTEGLKIVGFKCGVCGYIHKGDTLPKDFTCPICGQGAEVFSPIYE